MRESDIMRLVQVEVSKRGHRVFRNNVGFLKNDRGQYVHFGLCEGSSDLIGWCRNGRFLAIEVKVPGSRTKPERLVKQQAFIDAVNAAGGIAFFATSPEDAMSKLGAEADYE